ncbi:hypothetical protein OO015_00230 [Thermomicrobium sp. 4228-Ro]|uniref:hypothetical protein n=1 Tax=Thermomicrobium sp. 4228-Ro TaxID=2993937 RepID=UPI0022496261|nr:hypothetical protein [Thermomicrobium sp. 4228-Ro]MCX2725938.1 hypothetical protein [Thermomicrobium sp. 4228-Ro]
MRLPPTRSWAFLFVGFALGTASGVTISLLFTRPIRRLRGTSRPPDPAVFLQ